MAKKKGTQWIQDAIQNPGSLRQALKTPPGKNIPAKKLDAAARGEFGPAVQKKANLARTLRKLGR